MNVKEIRELADLVARRGLASLELEQEGFRLRIEGPRPVPRGAAVASPAPAYPAVPVTWEEKAVRAEAGAPGSATAPPAAPEAEHGLHLVTSPIVGTFYRSPNPDSDPFVKAGDAVEKGATLCIVEAMKLMNEIEADVAGTVVEVFPKNGQPVEFGEKLFAIRPA